MRLIDYLLRGSEWAGGAARRYGGCMCSENFRRFASPCLPLSNMRIFCAICVFLVPVLSAYINTFLAKSEMCFFIGPEKAPNSAPPPQK